MNKLQDSRFIFTENNPTDPTSGLKDAVTDRKKIIFLTSSEYGQANVVLAVAYELLLRQEHDIHIASFAPLKGVSARTHFKKSCVSSSPWSPNFAEFQREFILLLAKQADRAQYFVRILLSHAVAPHPGQHISQLSDDSVTHCFTQSKEIGERPQIAESPTSASKLQHLAT